jgi:glycosyltransferase involved in cell wall biosynthesis
MNKIPEITIITVCYNESPERIHRTFTNIADQSYDNIEWLVIDGGSNPETMTAIHKYDSHINKLVSENDDGIYDAMNKGVILATGEWVNFMNVGDSFAEQDTITSVVNVIMSRPGFDCYYGDIINVDDEDNARWVVRMQRTYNKRVFHNDIISHQSLFVKRHLFALVGGFDTSYKIAADKDWMLRTTLAGAKGLHTGLVICRSNANLSMDFDWCCREDAIIRHRYYSRLENAILTIHWIVNRLITRIRNHDFKIPAAWRNYAVLRKTSRMR